MAKTPFICLAPYCRGDFFRVRLIGKDHKGRPWRARVCQNCHCAWFMKYKPRPVQEARAARLEATIRWLDAEFATCEHAPG